MIKLAFCLRKLPELSREEFQQYWRKQHGDLVMSLQPAIGFVRYVQFHAGYEQLSARAAEFRSSPEAFDGIAEMWWEDIDTMVKSSSTDQARSAFAALYQDEKKFIDLKNSPMWYGTEHLMYDGQ